MTIDKISVVPFWNKIESPDGTAFLQLNDEVTIWTERGVNVCSEWPRGYV